ncbi:hypothetical protein HanIR_Chr05g0222191 [Helianthus annuus]|nr:hypothetical protein HanIR_Chr05g0222191 [Helianthus annuus]
MIRNSTQSLTRASFTRSAASVCIKLTRSQLSEPALHGVRVGKNRVRSPDLTENRGT